MKLHQDSMIFLHIRHVEASQKQIPAAKEEDKTLNVTRL